MKRKISNNARLKKFGKQVELIVYDFDGVMTDNRVILREDGLESVVVNRSDGLAVGIIKTMGIRQIILSTETNKVVETRAKKLAIPVLKGVRDKKQRLLFYCTENNIDLGKTVYVGNDINDVEAMEMVGYPICPANASEEIKKISKIILDISGGSGVVRDLLRLL